MKAKKVMVIMLCSALVATGSGVSTMAEVVTNGVTAEEEQKPPKTALDKDELSDEEKKAEGETEVTVGDTSATETESPEESTTEVETEDTEESTSEAETEDTEESTTEVETEAPEESSTEAETEAPEENTTETETDAVEEETAEAETKAPEESTTEAETESAEDTLIGNEMPRQLDLEEMQDVSELEATVTNEAELQAAVAQSGTINIDGDIELTDMLVIKGDVSVTLEGGRLFIGDETDLEDMISVRSGAKVTLSGVEIDATGLDYVSGIRGEAGKLDADYYAVTVISGELTIGDGTVIKSEDDRLPKNLRKRGVSTSDESDCIMDGGTITGFIDGGLTVSGNLTLNGGTISNNGREKNGGGLQTGDQSQVYMHGGIIEDNAVGILYSGKLFIDGGEITGNYTGMFSNNEEGTTGEYFYPEAEITGGIISNSPYAAIVNTVRSKLKLAGDADIRGKILNEEGSEIEISENANVSSEPGNDDNVRVMSLKKDTPYIISNDSDATLIITGGTITSNGTDEIAVWNGDSGIFTMTDGKIIAKGTRSVAVMNTNKSDSAVQLTGGSISVTGADSKVLDNYGSITVDGITVEKGGKTNLHFINVIPAEGGSVVLPDSMAEEGEEITASIQPDSGYKISDVTVDGVSKGAVSSYILKVTGSHTITARFVKKPSSGGNGGGGGSSRSSSTSSQSKVPETPGTWVQDQKGWKFALPTGSDYLNTWIYVKGQWYRIGLDGYMMQGWVVIDGKTYYLAPMTGEMKTGWFIDNGSYYYLDSAGAVSTGWVQVNGAWYYLNTDGKMAVDTTTPDGYKVGADGKRIQ